jgi:hypothetical protein
MEKRLSNSGEYSTKQKIIHLIYFFELMVYPEYKQTTMFFLGFTHFYQSSFVNRKYFISWSNVPMVFSPVATMPQGLWGPGSVRFN